MEYKQKKIIIFTPQTYPFIAFSEINSNEEFGCF